MTSIFDDDRKLYADINRRLVAAATGKTSAATYARALYAELCKIASEQGQKPEIEVSISKPGEPRHYADTGCWAVVWEAGPHDWAVGASMALTVETRTLVEPYYGFDLCVYPGEFTKEPG